MIGDRRSRNLDHTYARAEEVMTPFSQISSVLVTPFVHRPSYDSSCGPDSADDMCLGQLVCYPIPSSDVLASCRTSPHENSRLKRGRISPI